MQIILALTSIQDHCGFIHGDLHGNNILIVDAPSKVLTYYIRGKMYTLFTNYLVKIIDYGDSKVRGDYASRYENNLGGFRSPTSDLAKLYPYMVEYEDNSFKMEDKQITGRKKLNLIKQHECLTDIMIDIFKIIHGADWINLETDTINKLSMEYYEETRKDGEYFDILQVIFNSHKDYPKIIEKILVVEK